MATVQETTRRLVIEATTRGVSESEQRVRSLGKGYDDLAVSSRSNERASQSMEKRLESINRRYDQEYRAQKDLAKVKRDLDTAVGQGLIKQTAANDLMQKAILHHNSVSAATSLHARVTQEAAVVAQGYASSLGPIGAILTRIGPVGLAAAGVVGVLAYGMKQASDAANKFADDMGRLADMAETVGLTATQLQAINDAGAKFALTEDRIGQVLQRFTAQMDELRQGSGELFELVRRIDPALAREMQLARGTAVEIDLLAQVYLKAGDARQKLDRLLGGRQGGTVGLLIQDIGKQGGVEQLTGEFKKSGDAIDTELIARIRVLKREIDDMSQDASRNLTSIFSEPLLGGVHALTEAWLRATRAAKEHMEWRRRLRAERDASPFEARWAATTPLAVAPSAVVPQITVGLTLEAQLRAQRELVGVMGAAATATEKLTGRRLELDIALRNNVISQEQYGRALGMERLQEQISLEARRIGLLGDEANVSDIVAQKQREINLANAQGVIITKEQSAAILERTRLQREYASLPNQLAFERDQIGRTGIEAAVAARLRSAGQPIDLNSTYANLIRVNEQLKLGKDLATDFAQGFASDMMRGVKASEALGNALQRLAGRLMNMGIDNLMAAAFGGGGGGGLFSALFGGGSSSTISGGGSFMITSNALGNAYNRGNVIPFARGGIVNFPTLFPMANGAGLMGEGGPEAVMPLARGPDGSLGVRASGGSGAAAPVIINQTNNFFGADPGSEARLRAALQITKQSAVREAVQAVAGVRRNNPNYLAG